MSHITEQGVPSSICSKYLVSAPTNVKTTFNAECARMDFPGNQVLERRREKRERGEWRREKRREERFKEKRKREKRTKYIFLILFFLKAASALVSGATALLLEVSLFLFSLLLLIFS